MTIDEKISAAELLLSLAQVEQDEENTELSRWAVELSEFMLRSLRKTKDDLGALPK